MHSPLRAPQRADENKLLAALGHPHPPHFCSQLERISLSQGEVIYEPDTGIEYVYFPERAVFSMLSEMENGDTVEVGRFCCKD